MIAGGGIAGSVNYTLRQRVDVVVNGVRLHARLEGRADGQAVVLVHSLGTDMRLWDAVAPALAGRFRVLCVDLRGHGGSAAPPGPYALDDLAGDVLGLADHFGLGRPFVAGASLGALTALAVALRAPARIAGIVVCNTRTDVSPEFAAAIDARNEIIRAQGMQAVAATAPSRWLSPTTLARRPEVAAKVAAMVAGASAEGFIACTEAIKRSDLDARLAEVAVPALFVASTEDPGLPAAVIWGMRARVRGAVYAEIAEAGHLSPLENPDAVSAALVRFMDGAG